MSSRILTCPCPSKFQLKMHSFVTSQIFSNVSHTTDIVELLYYLWSYVYMLSFESRVRVKCVNGCKWSVICEESILCTLCLETIALFSLFPQKPSMPGNYSVIFSLPTKALYAWKLLHYFLSSHKSQSIAAFNSFLEGLSKIAELATHTKGRRSSSAVFMFFLHLCVTVILGQTNKLKKLFNFTAYAAGMEWSTAVNPNCSRIFTELALRLN